LCFFWAVPRFHEDKFTTPWPPFLRGIVYAIHRITRLNKMKIPIQLNYLLDSFSNKPTLNFSPLEIKGAINHGSLLKQESVVSATTG